MPGSVVRVDRYTQRMKDAGRGSMDNRFWLVEQPGGLTCTQVRWIDDQQIVPLPCRPPGGNWPLRLPAEARILGLVDTGPAPTTLPYSAGWTESGRLHCLAVTGDCGFRNCSESLAHAPV